MTGSNHHPKRFNDAVAVGMSALPGACGCTLACAASAAAGRSAPGATCNCNGGSIAVRATPCLPLLPNPAHRTTPSGIPP